MKKKINLNKKQKIVLSITIASILIAGAFVYSSIKSNKKQMNNLVELYTVAGKEKIYMSGQVLPKNSQNLFVNSEQGQLDKIKVDDEQYVEKGTLLFTCKNTSQINEIYNLKTAMASKKKERQNAPDDESKKAIDMDIKDLNTQISNLNKTAYQGVYAPFSGIVYVNDKSQNKDTSLPIVTIQTTDFYASAQVNERDSYKISLNQDIELTAIATKQTYKGSIAKIGQRPIESENSDQGFGVSSGMTQYGVDISLKNQENLKSGLHVQIMALYGSDEKKIPTESIITEDGKSYVYKIIDNVAYKSEISISKTQEDFSLVKSGVKEGDEIVKDIQSKNITDGQIVYTSMDEIEQ